MLCGTCFPDMPCGLTKNTRERGTSLAGPPDSLRIIAMYYTYVLRSKKDGRLYVGFIKDLKERVSLHNFGKVQATAARRSLSLIYYEACLNADDAVKRQKYLKTGYGRRYLKSRLEVFLLADVE